MSLPAIATLAERLTPTMPFADGIGVLTLLAEHPEGQTDAARALALRVQGTLLPRVYLVLGGLLEVVGEETIRNVFTVLTTPGGEVDLPPLLRWPLFREELARLEAARAHPAAGTSLGDEYRGRLHAAWTSEEVNAVIEDAQADIRLGGETLSDVLLESVSRQMMLIGALPRRRYLLMMADIIERGHDSPLMRETLLSALSHVTSAASGFVEDTMAGERDAVPSDEEWRDRVAVEALVGATQTAVREDR